MFPNINYIKENPPFLEMLGVQATCFIHCKWAWYIRLAKIIMPFTTYFGLQNIHFSLKMLSRCGVALYQNESDPVYNEHVYIAWHLFLSFLLHFTYCLEYIKENALHTRRFAISGLFVVFIIYLFIVHIQFISSR